MTLPAPHPAAPIERVAVRPPWLEASRLAALYLAVAGGYVFFSSRLATRYAASTEDLAKIEMLKGLGFIAVSTVALWVLNHRQLVRVRRRDAQFRRMDRALQQAERSAIAGTIARTVAHDINNGLMSASMALEELQDRTQGDVELTGLVVEARAAVARIADWNRRFFNLGAERPLEEVRPFDLVPMLRTTCDIAQRHEALQRVTLDQALPPSAPFRGSAALMQRAILNLLLNAAQAAGAGQRVRLELSQVEHGRYRLVVDDSGPGIPPALRARVLDPFYTTKPDGTGLGLASVVACADFHRGVLTIDDSPMGGARFALTLA
ncbi:MAG TPA: HAMP domain-containing sensor histidine kinase [Gemmatimonadaceae bacterium]|nr:HAMP domain-containing sensor histidine kinase [Gemmatimonadaceae bacterium]